MSVVVRVEVDGCAANKAMVLQMMYPLGAEVRDGCVVDSVWKLSVPGVPTCFVRLNGGRKSLRSLLEKYSFVDEDGCAYSAEPEAQTVRNVVHNARKVGEFVDPNAVRRALAGSQRRTRWRTAQRAAVLRYVPDATEEMGGCHFEKTGIAQLSERSGICWYSSLWFSLLSAPALYEHIAQHVRRRRGECPHCAYLCDHMPKILHSHAESEAVRRYLYEKLAIGDDPDQNPEEDGQNGASMGTLVFGGIRLPVTTVIAPWMKRADDIVLQDSHGRDATMPPAPQHGERALLLVRTYRTRWKAPERLEWGDGARKKKRYTLMSALIGSEFCGHQISIARSCEDGTWAVSDSDGIRLGILPICFRKPKGVEWADLVPQMIPFSNATNDSQFCDMATSGRHPLKLMHDTLAAQGAAEVLESVDTNSRAHDLINIDFWYLEDM